ncbi:MAG: RNA polymerase sigma factor [Verrucomicrobiales bacterium]|nr:RNA polymerase sigma factor [Verrucomicrobiales bacterium]
MADEEDKRTMERLRQGDDLALNDVMARWKEPLVTYCLRYTGNLTDAKEIAQETFVKVYKARHRYRPTEAAFSTWLFQIATNLCRMRHRWKKRHPEVLEADDPTQTTRNANQASTNDDPADTTDRRLLADDLERAIRSLTHDLRATFLLSQIEGRSHREIAGIQNCTEKAVERRLSRAKEKLRSVLETKWSNYSVEP